MGQGVHRTQTGNHPIRLLETAEELEQVLDWHGFIRFGEETKKPLGSLEMDGNSLVPTQLDRVLQSMSVLSSAPLSAVTGLIPVSKATFGVL